MGQLDTVKHCGLIWHHTLTLPFAIPLLGTTEEVAQWQGHNAELRHQLQIADAKVGAWETGCMGSYAHGGLGAWGTMRMGDWAHGGLDAWGSGHIVDSTLCPHLLSCLAPTRLSQLHPLLATVQTAK